MKKEYEIKNREAANVQKVYRGYQGRVRAKLEKQADDKEVDELKMCVVSRRVARARAHTHTCSRGSKGEKRAYTLLARSVRRHHAGIRSGSRC